MKRARIFLTGVGGQGTLTATKILALTAMDAGLEVTSGEIHGMAQRGGVVESTILIGGYRSPKISHGEADLLLGFELLETLRALPYLKKGGTIISNSESILPPGVAKGVETYPDVDAVAQQAQSCGLTISFLPCKTLGLKAGAVQSANMVLLGAFLAKDLLPFGVEALKQSVRTYLKPKLVDLNLHAIDLGVQAASE
ncbi:indolepyruvate oxidoreductase subunit beta [Desulfovibrio inopinatus]|uniref:indolepyruvate oxidoreductase subunit beta n=1 Tax=Desulfovibrio inopinatus TaxID=102109 RepID=UPI0003FE243C|nr:indolepyruvate oxidoreductase subunit beta [Desulfovibrio inopinatus]